MNQDPLSWWVWELSLMLGVMKSSSWLRNTGLIVWVVTSTTIRDWGGVEESSMNTESWRHLIVAMTCCNRCIGCMWSKGRGCTKIVIDKIIEKVVDMITTRG